MTAAAPARPCARGTRPSLDSETGFRPGRLVGGAPGLMMPAVKTEVRNQKSGIRIMKSNNTAQGGQDSSKEVYLIWCKAYPTKGKGAGAPVAWCRKARGEWCGNCEWRNS